MKLYVINLERSKDRLAHITQTFYECGLVFERVDAVDGRALDDEEFARLTSERRWEKKLTRSEVGCFLSHRECLRRIMEGNEPYGAIFEDDIKLSPNASRYLKQSDWIAGGTDMVKLDTAQTRCLVSRIGKIAPDGRKLVKILSKHYCAGAYIISKQCAQKLYALTEYAWAPIDEIYFNPDCNVMNDLYIEQLYPALAVQVGLTSTIRADEQQKLERVSSSLPFYKKVGREIRRANKKQQLVKRFSGFGRFKWGEVPFR